MISVPKIIARDKSGRVVFSGGRIDLEDQLQLIKVSASKLDSHLVAQDKQYSVKYAQDLNLSYIRSLLTDYNWITFERSAEAA